MPFGLAYLNLTWQAESLDCRNAFVRGLWYCEPMANRLSRGDWYLKEWLATLGKRQSDIVRDLEWNKARISLMIAGKQPYTRDSVNELSLYLNLLPFELLMHPSDAMALRALRDDVARIATSTALTPYETTDKKVSTG